jgi:hypothetical protein
MQSGPHIFNRDIGSAGHRPLIVGNQHLAMVAHVGAGEMREGTGRKNATSPPAWIKGSSERLDVPTPSSSKRTSTPVRARRARALIMARPTGSKFAVGTRLSSPARGPLNWFTLALRPVRHTPVTWQGFVRHLSRFRHADHREIVGIQQADLHKNGSLIPVYVLMH